MRLSTTPTPRFAVRAKIRLRIAKLSGSSQMCGGGTTLRISAPLSRAKATSCSASAADEKKSQCTVKPTRGGGGAAPATATQATASNQHPAPAFMRTWDGSTTLLELAGMLPSGRAAHPQAFSAPITGTRKRDE